MGGMSPMTLGGAGLGLNALSDIMGAYSANQQQKRQRDLYNQMRDPNRIAAGINATYQPLSDAGQQAVNRNVQAEMAMRGVQQGGQGDLASARAWAELESQRRAQAANAYLQSLQMASGNIGQAYGTHGATGQGLSQLAILAAIQGRNQGQTQNPYGLNWEQVNPAFTSFDPTYDYGTPGGAMKPAGGMIDPIG